MGNIFADALPPERVKSIFSAYLTEKEEEALRASFEGHYDIKGALNLPGLTLIGDEDLMNADTFLNFVVKLLRNNRTARVTLEAITSKDKAKAYFVLLSSWSCSHEKQQEIHEMEQYNTRKYLSIKRLRGSDCFNHQFWGLGWEIGVFSRILAIFSR